MRSRLRLLSNLGFQKSKCDFGQRVRTQVLIMAVPGQPWTKMTFLRRGRPSSANDARWMKSITEPKRTTQPAGNEQLGLGVFVANEARYPFAPLFSGERIHSDEQQRLLLVHGWNIFGEGSTGSIASA